MHRVRWLRRILRAGMLRIFTALSFSITVFFVVVLIGVQRAEVTRHNRYVAESSAEWNVIQLMSQLERFSSFLEYFMRTGDTKDLNFHQRYEILWSRVLMLVDNPENAGVAAVKSFEASARRADERFAALEPVILAFHPRDEEGYKKIGALLQELRQQLVTLQTDVHKERVAANAQLLISRLYTRQATPLAGCRVYPWEISK